VAKAADKSTPSDPSKIKLSDLVRVEDMYERMRKRVAHRQSIVETMNDLEDRFRRDWRTWEPEVDSNGEEIPGTLKPVSDDWKTTPRLLIDGTDKAPYLRVLDRRDRPPKRAEFFGLARDIEDWESKHPMLEPAAPSKEPNRILRRRHSKYPWNEICGEIARRCIDPKTRCLRVPKNESKLADDVLQWCRNTLGLEPPTSDLREAVKTICAALRKI
jgi:hypothetical protein